MRDDRGLWTGPFDTLIFAGGLETFIQYAKSHCGDAVIGFIANFRLPASSIGRLSDMSEDFGTAECLPDHIHPNSKGYNLLAPVIGDWMQALAIASAEQT